MDHRTHLADVRTTLHNGYDQMRIVVPEGFLRHANIRRKISVVYHDRGVDVWNPVNYESFFRDLETKYAKK